MTTVNDSPFSLINFNDMKQIFSEYQGQGSESQDKIIHRHPNIFNSSGEYLFMPFLDTFIRPAPQINDAKKTNAKVLIEKVQTRFENGANKVNNIITNIFMLNSTTEKEQKDFNKKLETKRAAAATAAEAKRVAKQAAAEAKRVAKQAAKQAEADDKSAISIFNYGYPKNADPLPNYNINSAYEYEIPPHLYSDKSAVGFFDTLHDFSLEFCDSEKPLTSKDSSYANFMFSSLLYGGYPQLWGENDNNLKNYQSTFAYLQKYPRPLTDGLENYFAIGNMYNLAMEAKSKPTDGAHAQADDNLQIVLETKLDPIINPVTGKTQVIKGEKQYNTDVGNIQASKQLLIYNHLANFFKDYIDREFIDIEDGTDNVEGKIKLCIDCQSNLFKIMRQNKQHNKFCLLYTAETITDSAFKSKAETIDEVFGYKNWYIEALNSETSRGHYGGYGNDNGTLRDSVKGNISVVYTNINYNKPDNLEDSNYTVDLKYYYEKNVGDKYTQVRLNDSESVTMNKEITTKKSVSDRVTQFLNNFSKTLKIAGSDVITKLKALDVITKLKALNNKSNPQQRKEFYDVFNTVVLSQQLDINDPENILMKYSLYYAIKRLGDTLQAEVCRLAILTNMFFYKVKRYDAVPPKKKFTFGYEKSVRIKPTKGAVLVTHDRMLFTYAVINNIPVILDLDNHMIIFKPNTSEVCLNYLMFEPEQGGGGRDIYMEEDNVTKSFGGNPINNRIQSGGNNTDQLAHSIMTNVNSFIRYLYYSRLIGLSNIKPFLKDVSNTLYNENVEESISNMTDSNDYYNKMPQIAYIANYKYPVLVIGNLTFIDTITIFAELEEEEIQSFYSKVNLGSIQQITRSDVKKATALKTGDLIAVQPFIMIYLNDIDYLFLTNIFDGSDREIEIEFRYDKELTQTGSSHNNNNIPKGTFTETNIKSTLSQRFLNLFNEYNEDNEDNEFIIKILNIIINASDEEDASGGGYRGGAPNKSSYQEILGADFGKLNNTEKLLQNNITVLTYLHQLLREYELSFINYEEGIDTFYCKIDESVQLSYTIGLHNFMPRDIEFYVFLTFLIQDYNTETITTINFALFEYYLYMTKEENDIYFNYLTIKSYLLDISYQVSMTEENKAKLQQNITTYEYFKTLMEKVTNTSYTILQEIYSDIQQKNTDYVVTYKNVDEYNLKLCGFSDLQEEFTDKTLKIIGDLVKAKSPLILEFVEKAKAQQTIKEGEEETKVDEVDEVDEVDKEFVKVVPYDDDNVEQVIPTDILITKYDETDNNNVKQVIPTDILITKYDETDNNNVKQVVPTGKEEENIGRGLIERYNPLKDDIASEAAGGKKHKLSKNKYRKEKNKTKRKRTKRQGTKIKVNQTKKNRKNKKKRNTKRNKE